MNRVLVDTNILLDVFLERHPHCLPAQTVWTLVERKQIQAAISAVSVNNVFFIIKKLSSKEKATKAIETLVDIFSIVEINSKIIVKTLAGKFDDFEDGLQYHSALKYKAQAILTRNPDDFRKSQIPVMDCAMYLASRL